ncbi:MAG TPA: phage holin family protein [Candidatus Acidoferrum sp.]|jgi:uncharacterized membrane protein YqjE
MPAPQMQRSVPEVLQDIIGNFERIIRSEFRLAKTEIREEASQAVKPVSVLGVGLVLGFLGLGFLLLASVYALSLVIAPWLAALLVGGLLAIVSSILIASSSANLKQLNPTPDKTIRSLEENVQWAKNQIK